MNLQPPARTLKDYILPFLIIIALGIVVVLIFRVIPQTEWGEKINSKTESGLSGEAELSVIKNTVEIYLPAAEAWKITGVTAVVNPGENVRTSTNGRAELLFNDGTILVLGGGSELEIKNLYNKLNKKTVTLNLVRGSTWIKSENDTNIAFSIDSTMLHVSDVDGTLFITTNEKETTITTILGESTATILDPQNPKKPELKTFILEENEALAISERRVNLLRIGGDIDLIKATSNKTKQEELYRAMMGDSTIDSSAAKNEDENEPEETEETSPDSPTAVTPQPPSGNEPIAPPTVLTGNGVITSTSEPTLISGVASPATTKIEITPENGIPYLLSRFKPGSGEWSYNASVQFGNLKIGKNTYTAVAIDDSGNRSPAAVFTINFNPDTPTQVEPEEETPPLVENEEDKDDTSGVPVVGVTTFAAPTVSEPTDGTTFSEAPIHFAGEVPSNTKEVLINEYKLTSFSAGDLNWNYNASPDYENLEVGENEFEIVAINENGDQSSVVIKITYSPED